MPVPRHCLDCRRLTTKGSRCSRCTMARARVHSRERQHHDAAHRFRSTYAWQKLRYQVLHASPVCVDCGATDDLTVDHVVPLAEGGAPLDPANLQVRCRRCNSARRPR